MFSLEWMQTCEMALKKTSMKNKILVHCQAGIGRSSVVALVLQGDCPFLTWKETLCSGMFCIHREEVFIPLDYLRYIREMRGQAVRNKVSSPFQIQKRARRLFKLLKARALPCKSRRLIWAYWVLVTSGS